MAVVLSLFSLGALAGCDRMITPHKTQLMQDADAKVQAGDYLDAINFYEAALDGSAGAAAIHYKLGLLYDDQMNDPLDALHHFKRFLTLEPSGKRADEVRGFMKRDELTLLTKLSGDAVVTRAEAVHLQNENLALRKQIEDRWEERKAGAAAEKQRRATSRPNDTKTRSYTVQPGDTLAAISRKFYKTSSRWGKILAANPEILTKPGDLKPGQELRIP